MATILAYLFFFTAASASPLQRRWLATKRDGGGQIAFAFRVMGMTALFGLLLPLIRPFSISGNWLHLASLSVVCGLFGAGYFILNYSAQKHVDAGVTNLVTNIYTPVTIVLAILFLGEGLKPLQVLGTALLLVAVVLVSKKHHMGKLKFDKYFTMMLISGIMVGFTLTAERALIKTTGFSAGVLMSWWAQTLGLGIATFVTKSKTTYSLSDTLTTGILRFLQSLSWVVLLLVVNNLSVVSAVTTFKVVIIFIAAALFLNEREDLGRKIAGSTIALVGLLLMK